MLFFLIALLTTRDHRHVRIMRHNRDATQFSFSSKRNGVFSTTLCGRAANSVNLFLSDRSSMIIHLADNHSRQRTTSRGKFHNQVTEVMLRSVHFFDRNDSSLTIFLLAPSLVGSNGKRGENLILLFSNGNASSRRVLKRNSVVNHFARERRHKKKTQKEGTKSGREKVESFLCK